MIDQVSISLALLGAALSILASTCIDTGFKMAIGAEPAWLASREDQSISCWVNNYYPNHDDDGRNPVPYSLDHLMDWSTTTSGTESNATVSSIRLSSPGTVKT